jgi:hypothetical protein
MRQGIEAHTEYQATGRAKDKDYGIGRRVAEKVFREACLVAFLAIQRRSSWRGEQRRSMVSVCIEDLSNDHTSKSERTGTGFFGTAMAVDAKRRPVRTVFR